MQSKVEEIWKDVIGYEGLYIISDLGRLMSVKKNTFGVSKNKIIKPSICNGYYFYYPSKNGKRKYKSIHSMVMEAFVGKSKLHIHHIDENKLNNRLDNLMYVTCRQNIHYSLKKEVCTSKYIGVFFRKNNWVASICFNKSKIQLGEFKSEIEAKECYDKAIYDINNGVFRIPIKCCDYKVYYHKKSNRWQAYMIIDGDNKWVGLFDSKNDAINYINKKLYE